MKQRQGKAQKTSGAPATGRLWRIYIDRRTRAPGISTARVRRYAIEILAALAAEPLPPSVSELSIVLVGDRAMRSLNRDFRGKDKPTDVLSFSQIEGENGIPSPTLGDLVISIDTTRRQAQAYGVTFEREIVRLMVHGILHLHGYDHEGVPKAAAQRMRRQEERVLKRVLG